MIRDNKYWVCYNNMKQKHPEWSINRLHAATAAMIRKAA